MNKRTVAVLLAIWATYCAFSVIAAVYFGIGYVIALMALLHVFLAFPSIRSVVLGKQHTRMENVDQKPSQRVVWPTKSYVVLTLMWIALAIVAVTQVNIRLIDLFSH